MLVSLKAFIVIDRVYPYMLFGFLTLKVKQTRFLLWVYYDLKEAILKQVDRQVQGFEKRNDEQAVELMNAYVVAVLDELTALYLHIDVVLKKKDQLDQRGARSAFHHLYYTT
ncbi:hypothetical protein Hanom_Chr16g01434221 [Helianthus anomalus]